MPGRPSCPPVVPPLSLASILSVMATPCSKPPNNLETQFHTNHLSYPRLFHYLKPLPLAPNPSRLISVSSTGHRKPPHERGAGIGDERVRCGRGGVRGAGRAVFGGLCGAGPVSGEGSDGGGTARGLAARAFDGEGEERLWMGSLGMVGLEGEESSDADVVISQE